MEVLVGLLGKLTLGQPGCGSESATKKKPARGYPCPCCKKKGQHFVKDCPNNKKNKKNALLTLAESAKSDTKRKRPPRDYVCSCCTKKGHHFVQDCPNNRQNKKRSQALNNGEVPLFGEFRCPKCWKEWVSGNSYANCWQKCKDCDIKVYPYEQSPLDGSGSGEKNKPHLQHLCGKCEELGYCCRVDDEKGAAKFSRNRGSRR